YRRLPSTLVSSFPFPNTVTHSPARWRRQCALRKPSSSPSRRDCNPAMRLRAFQRSPATEERGRQAALNLRPCKHPVRRLRSRIDPRPRGSAFENLRCRLSSAHLAEIPRYVILRVGLHRRIRTGLVIARIDADLIVFGDALVCEGSNAPQPGQFG